MKKTKLILGISLTSVGTVSFLVLLSYMCWEASVFVASFGCLIAGIWLLCDFEDEHTETTHKDDWYRSRPDRDDEWHKYLQWRQWYIDFRQRREQSVDCNGKTDKEYRNPQYGN